MTRPLLIALCACFTLVSCGAIRDSRFNPFNWFGRSESQALDAATQAAATRRDPRPLVSQVVAMTVEQTPGGAIITATGLPPTQGFFEAALVDETDAQAAAAGAKVFAFRMVPPDTRQPQGTPRSRQITVAEFLTEQELVGISRIVVIAQANQRTARR